jgi:hypothetical protein
VLEILSLYSFIIRSELLPSFNIDHSWSVVYPVDMNIEDFVGEAASHAFIYSRQVFVTRYEKRGVAHEWTV